MKINKKTFIRKFHKIGLSILDPSLSSCGGNFEVPAFHYDILSALEGEVREQLICAPVQFAKSSIARIWSVYRLLSRQDRIVIYLSSTRARTRDHFKTMKRVIENQGMISLCERIHGVGRYEIIVDRELEIVIRFDDGYEASIRGTSAGMPLEGVNFLGSRPSLIVADDMEDFDQAKSVYRTNNLQEWLFMVLLERLPSPSEGRFRMINSNLSINSLTNKIITCRTASVPAPEFFDFDCRVYPALDENSKSIWESKFPTHIMLRERESRPLYFQSSRMCCPSDLTSTFVPLEYVLFYDHVDIDDIDYIYAHADTTHKADNIKKGDYYCLVSIGHNKKDNNLYVLDIILDRINVLEQAESIISILKKYGRFRDGGKLRKITFDEKANQGFGLVTRQMAREKYNIDRLPLEELRYSSDKVTHFEPHTQFFYKNKMEGENKIFLPKNSKFIKEAVHQLTSFPSGTHDDFIDGLSGCLDKFVNSKRGAVLSNLFMNA